MMKGATKTNRFVDQEGRTRWQEKKAMPILVCVCGEKYLKTRRGQQECLECFTGERIYGAIH